MPTELISMQQARNLYVLDKFHPVVMTLLVVHKMS